jgi:hypothetical protein
MITITTRFMKKSPKTNMLSFSRVFLLTAPTEAVYDAFHHFGHRSWNGYVRPHEAFLPAGTGDRLRYSRGVSEDQQAG